MLNLIKSNLGDIVKMEDVDGLVFIGCGGDLTEYVKQVNEYLLEQKAIYNVDAFSDVYSFDVDYSALEENIIHCLFFKFPEDMKDISIGRLAIVRLTIQDCKWHSDFVPMIKEEFSM